MISHSLNSWEQQTHKKDVVPQPEILKMGEVECQVEDSRLIVNSLKNHKFDRYHAIYYLLLKR